MTFGNSAFTFAGQPLAGALTPGVSLEAKSLSGWQAAWAAGRDYSPGGVSQIAKPLEQSAWVLACVRLLAGPLASVPLQWFDSADTSSRSLLAEDGERSRFWQAPCEDDFGPV